MALEFTDESIKEIISSGKPVVVDFWAEWCGPCRMVGPIIEELAKEYEGQVVVGKLNVDDNVETPNEYGIRNIPTILFFKDGQLVDKQIGATQKSVFAAKIQAIL
jgi:thioredoxin 1